MGNAIASSPPTSLTELEQVLEARKLRLSESLRRPRAELLQRVASRLSDLRFATDMADLQSYERGRLAIITEARRGIEEARQLAAGYERALTQATAAMEQAKGEYERWTPLTEAPAKAKAIERYHHARIEHEVYQDAVDTLTTSLAEMERGLTRRLQSLEPEFAAYVSAKITAMAKEAEEALDAARGKIAHAEQLKQRAATFEQEFKVRYGLQEGV